MISSTADTDEDGELSEEELTALTVAQLKALAGEKGIRLTATKKADIIAEILAALADDSEETESESTEPASEP